MKDQNLAKLQLDDFWNNLNYLVVIQVSANRTISFILCKNGKFNAIALYNKGNAIMNDRSKIKIVKKGDALPLKIKKRKTAAPPLNTAREMVSTVSDWVADFKTRKSAETTAAFELFYITNPRPSEL